SAKVKLWPSIELNSAIFVWYHADNQEPSWQPEKVNEIANNSWGYRGRSEFVINCIPLVIAFPYIQTTFTLFNNLKILIKIWYLFLHQTGSFRERSRFESL